MKNNDCSPEQQNDCCDTSNESCCAISEPAKKKSWKRMSAILVLSLAMILAISAAVNAGQTQTPQTDSNGCGLPSITDFDWMETDEKVAFVFLKGTDEASNTILEKKLENVYLELKESGSSAALFILDETNEHYSEIKEECKMESFPAVAALGRGCQSSLLTGNINSTRLIKAYMLASTPAGSCSKGSSSCCSKSN